MKNGLVGGMGEIQASIISSILGSLQYFLKSIKSLFLMPGVSISHVFKWEVSKLFQKKRLSFHDRILLLISSEIHRHCYSHSVQQRLFARELDWILSE